MNMFFRVLLLKVITDFINTVCALLLSDEAITESLLLTLTRCQSFPSKSHRQIHRKNSQVRECHRIVILLKAISIHHCQYFRKNMSIMVQIPVKNYNIICRKDNLKLSNICNKTYNYFHNI